MEQVKYIRTKVTQCEFLDHMASMSNDYKKVQRIGCKFKIIRYYRYVSSEIAHMYACVVIEKKWLFLTKDTAYFIIERKQ